MSTKLTKRTIDSLTPKDKPYDKRDSVIKGFLVRVLPSGNKTYYYQYKNEEGKQRNYRIGNAGNITPIQARDTAENKAAEVIKGIDIQTEKYRKREEGLKTKYRALGGLINNKYSDWIIEHRKTGKQIIDSIELHFSQFYDRPLTEINSWIIEKWRTERLKNGISKATVNKNITELKSALSKAVEWELIAINPLAKVKPLKLDSIGKVRYLTKTEEKRLRKTLQTRDMKIKSERDSANRWRKERGYELLPDLLNCHYADHITPIVLLAINTGLRRGELFNLQWEDINFRNKTLTIQGKTAKSGNTRHVPLNPEASDVLKSWKTQNKGQIRMFYGKKGARLNNIKTAWSAMITNAKIKDFRFHDLRHTFASNLVMKGAPLNTVRELLGHSDLKTTLRYAHLAPDHKAEAVALL
jgi:integrase